jgi:hypothetical protein
LVRIVKRYLSFYLEHMRLEEAVILPAAFATNCDPPHR